MRALVLQTPDALPVLTEVPTPAPGPGEVRVELRAAALNRRDLWITRGQYPGIRFPSILGSDGAGVVAELGAGVADEGLARLGTEVIINPSLHWGEDEAFQGPDFEILGLPRAGTLAESVVVPAANLYAKPTHLDWPQAAAWPLAGLTAWRALMSRGAARPGDRVLVTGVGGGAASFAFQFAVAHGLETAVSSGSEAKLAVAQAGGATWTTNYREADWAKTLQRAVPGGFQVIVDSAGGPGFADLVKLLAPGGRLVFFGGTAGAWPPINPAHLFFKQAHVLGSTMGSPREFAAMLDFVNAHRLVPAVDGVFGLSEAEPAFGRLAESSQQGKVVFDLSR
jgi:NADPH:quinone reductase-like Zn-dependent oxidoreductase